MLRPCHRLLGGCHFHGHTAVRRRRLRSTREMIFTESQTQKKTEEGVRRVRGGERQLDFVKNATENTRRFICVGSAPSLLSDWPRLRKRPPGGPTTTFMTLISERCFRLQLWDYFFSSKCNIFLLLIQIYEARAESGPGCCYMPDDLWPTSSGGHHVASHVTDGSNGTLVRSSSVLTDIDEVINGSVGLF